MVTTDTATEAAMLACILAAPDDDAPRLQFADWLEEYGMGERAEFIRVQLELAKLMPGGKCPKCGSYGGPCNTCESDPIDSLARRERGLWHAGTQFGINTLAFWPVVVHRGFVAEVACTAADFLEHAGALFATQPVERIVLSDKQPHCLHWNIAGGLEVGSNYIPRPIWDLLEGYDRKWPAPHEHEDGFVQDGKGYRTEAAALSALSAACVTYGRAAARKEASR